MGFAKLPKKNNENFIEESVQELTFEQALDIAIEKKDVDLLTGLLVNKIPDKLLDAVIYEIGKMQQQEEFGFNYNGYR